MKSRVEKPNSDNNSKSNIDVRMQTDLDDENKTRRRQNIPQIVEKRKQSRRVVTRG